MLLPIGPSRSIFGTTKGLLLLPVLRPRPGKEGRKARLFQRLSKNPPLWAVGGGPNPPGGGGGGGGN